MNGGEMFLLLLGPALALVAGLSIYGIAVRARPRVAPVRPSDRR